MNNAFKSSCLYNIFFYLFLHIEYVGKIFIEKKTGIPCIIYTSMIKIFSNKDKCNITVNSNNMKSIRVQIKQNTLPVD